MHFLWQTLVAKALSQPVMLLQKVQICSTVRNEIWLIHFPFYFVSDTYLDSYLFDLLTLEWLCLIFISLVGWNSINLPLLSQLYSKYWIGLIFTTCPAHICFLSSNTFGDLMVSTLIRILLDPLEKIEVFYQILTKMLTVFGWENLEISQLQVLFWPKI